MDNNPYSNYGWDVRSWYSSNILKEIDENFYKEKLLPLEEEIKEKKNKLKLEKIGHHFPVALTEKQIQKFKNNGFKIISLVES